jgi:hypothetical protein
MQTSVEYDTFELINNIEQTRWDWKGKKALFKFEMGFIKRKIEPPASLRYLKFKWNYGLVGKTISHESVQCEMEFYYEEVLFHTLNCLKRAGK